MYKTILAAVTILSFSQAVQANEKAEIWQCIDSNTISVKEDCMVKTIERHTENSDFFEKLAQKQMQKSGDVLATINYFPAQNLIQVKSIGPENSSLIAANK